jgi:hypothetical protein
MKTTKTLMLAAIAALSIGTGAAMAQEGDAQNLFNGSPRVFNEFAQGKFASGPSSFAANFAAAQPGAQNSRSVTMFGQSGSLIPAPNGSDGGAH